MNSDMNAVMAVLKGIVERGDPFAFLIPESGMGERHLATACAMALIAARGQNREPAFVVTPDGREFYQRYDLAAVPAHQVLRPGSELEPVRAALLARWNEGPVHRYEVGAVVKVVECQGVPSLTWSAECACVVELVPFSAVRDVRGGQPGYMTRIRFNNGVERWYHSNQLMPAEPVPSTGSMASAAAV